MDPDLDINSVTISVHTPQSDGSYFRTSWMTTRNSLPGRAGGFVELSKVSQKFLLTASEIRRVAPQKRQRIRWEAKYAVQMEGTASSPHRTECGSYSRRSQRIKGKVEALM